MVINHFTCFAVLLCGNNEIWREFRWRRKTCILTVYGSAFVLESPPFNGKRSFSESVQSSKLLLHARGRRGYRIVRLPVGDEPRLLWHKSNSNDPDRNVRSIFIFPPRVSTPAHAILSTRQHPLPDHSEEVSFC